VPVSVLRFKVETLDTNAKIAQLTKKVRELEVAVKNAGGSTKKAGKSTRAAGTEFKAFAGGAQAAAVGARGLGAALSAALGPLIAVGAAAASLGQAFDVLRQQDFAEAKVKSLGVNADQLKAQLQDVSRELSGQASVLDLTSAAYDVASAGFTNAADAANILKAASQGATGGFSDINTVGDATTSVLNAYGLEADKAAKLVDGFIQTQNDGKIVIGEYAANIAKVAPVAAALGVPLEEVNAAVAQITAGGQGAEVTFTALKTAFAQVAAGKVGKEFKALGVEINASTLKSDGLAGTLQKIKESGADAGTVIKAFGTEAGPSILALLNDTEKFNRLLENQKEAQGAAAAAAFEASDTIDGQIKRLTTAFQNLFSDQSELGIIIKETFKVAAVTVEVFGVALTNTLAPVRAIFAAINQVGQAVAEALGIEGVNAAFELEKAFQATLGRAAQFGEFVVGLGIRIGELVGGLASQIITAGKNSLGGVVGFFRTALEKIVGFIQGAYNLIPKPIRDFLEGGAAAVTSFVGETVALGQGVMQGATGAEQQQQQQQQQPTATNTISPTGGNLQKTMQDRISNAQKYLQEEAKAKAQIEKQGELLAGALQSSQRAVELAEARLNGTEDEVKLQHQIADIQEKFKDNGAELLIADLKRVKALEDQKEAQDALAKAEEERRKNDPGVQMQEQLDKLLDKQNQAAAAATAFGNAFSTAITSVINGTKTADQAIADMLSSVAEHFMNMAAQIIAKQLAMIAYGLIMKALGVGLGGGTSFAGDGGGFGISPDSLATGSPSSFGGGNLFAAEGAYVSSPTSAVVGEGGEPEYIIPESKMRESMARYSRGARGGSVIPEAGGSGTSGEGGGTAVAAPIDVRYTVERINSVDYVTADQFQQGMQQAANQGARQGEQQTLKRLQMSSGTRRRLGM
jgi:TP901 family phage tail tape measure protein